VKVKFNKFERVAGIFVLTAVLGSVAVTLAVAVKKGWFSSKMRYTAVLNSADGLHAGTAVQVAGLRAGSVNEVELISAEEVRVKFEVFEKFRTNIRQNSQLKVIRPFIIGEKVLEISVGDNTLAMLGNGAEIPFVESFDLMDILSGRKMGDIVGSLEQLTSNLKLLLEAFSDPRRTQALVNMFDKLDPLISNLSRLTAAANKDGRAEKLIVTLVSITGELDKVLPLLNAKSPDLGIQLGQVVNNLNILTQEFTKLTPAIAAVAPRLPETSLRAVEALDETVVLLKALQKSFLLKGKVEEVKEEENQRLPASR
jgi:phospholipid/cholesterol/gamma-HCH transport system substrate-binding protein